MSQVSNVSNVTFTCPTRFFTIFLKFRAVPRPVRICISMHKIGYDISYRFTVLSCDLRRHRSWTLAIRDFLTVLHVLLGEKSFLNSARVTQAGKRLKNEADPREAVRRHAGSLNFRDRRRGHCLSGLIMPWAEMNAREGISGRLRIRDARHATNFLDQSDAQCFKKFDREKHFILKVCKSFFHYFRVLYCFLLSHEF